MPLTIRKVSPDLKFDVAAPAGWCYAAGDTIIGNLVRHTPIVSPEATITLSLVGRIKTKITESKTNNRHTHYRSEARLVRSDQTIISGQPLHLPEGSGAPLSWQFAVNIPTEPLQSTRQVFTPSTSFVPLDRDHPAHHTLPGSFISFRDGLAVSSSCFVEYYLKALLRYTYKGSSKLVEAIWPFQINHPVEGTDLLSQLNCLSFNQQIQSQRLLPGMQHADLTFKQKTQKLFGSSKVPKFVFNMNIRHPAAIQLNHREPIPIILEIRPRPELTSPSVEDQSIVINWVRMCLHQCTSVLAPSNFLNDHAHDDNHHYSGNLNLEAAFQGLESPLVMSTAEKGEKRVNIGEMFQLALHPGGFSSGSQLLTAISPIPDFTTYSIQHTNAVEWKVSYSVAGETGTFKASSAIRIIASA